MKPAGDRQPRADLRGSLLALVAVAALSLLVLVACAWLLATFHP
jgi:hypothetical protein